MNALIRTVAIGFAKDMLVDIIGDMITPEGVVAWRTRLIAKMEELAAGTETRIDDHAVKYLVATILTPEGWAKYGREIIGWAKSYAARTETKYDDYVIPILTQLENAFCQ